jgi:hypothetical protein
VWIATVSLTRLLTNKVEYQEATSAVSHPQAVAVDCRSQTAPNPTGVVNHYRHCFVADRISTHPTQHAFSQQAEQTPSGSPIVKCRRRLCMGAWQFEKKSRSQARGNRAGLQSRRGFFAHVMPYKCHIECSQRSSLTSVKVQVMSGFGRRASAWCHPNCSCFDVTSRCCLAVHCSRGSCSLQCTAVWYIQL